MATSAVQVTMAVVPIANVIESTHNYRRRHDDAAHLELVASIREKGIITPLVVRPVNEHADQSWLYEVAAGHRRLRAARAAGLAEVPVSVREMDDREFAEIMLTENIQRVDPDPLDEATAYQQLIEQLGYDPATLALKFGKSETYVRSRLVLANLSERAREALGRGAIELGHALLLARTTPEKQDELLQKTLLVSRALQPAQFRPEEVEELGDEDYEPTRQEGSRKVATDPARTLVSIGKLRQIMAENLASVALARVDVPSFSAWGSAKVQPVIEADTGTYAIPSAFVTLGQEAGIDAVAVWTAAIAAVPAPAEKKDKKRGAK